MGNILKFLLYPIELNGASVQQSNHSLPDFTGSGYERLVFQFKNMLGKGLVHLSFTLMEAVKLLSGWREN